MKRPLLTLILWATSVLVAAPVTSLAAKAKVDPKTESAKLEKMLMQIDPSERFIQICSYAAAERIAADKTPYKPDRAVMDASTEAKIDGDKMTGDGAAFRSRNEWYQFSFNCVTTPDRMKILSFDYKVGEKIPEEKWEKFGLWR